MTEVFISYSRRDWLAAEGLAENLGSLGYDVWIDTGIKPNIPYAQEITDALDEADLAIVIWSKDAIKSEWVNWEASRALTSNKLLQLRTPDLSVEAVPSPFCDFTIYHDGGIEEVGRRIEEILSSLDYQKTSTLKLDLENDSPPPVQRSSIGEPEQSSTYSLKSSLLYGTFLLALGGLLSLTEAPNYFSSSIIAIGSVFLLVASLYYVYFSVSRFSDRFGRQTILEAILFGVMASLFAGIVGGYPYAAEHIDRLPGVSEADLFITKYIRVTIIATIAGTLLSYLLLALIRYINLTRQNLGPAWSRRNVSLQIATPVIFVIVLTLAISQLADRLPNLGYLVAKITLGKVDWIGAGQCSSISYCTNIDTTTFCRNCTVGDMSGVHISLILSIFLWSQHVFHMRQFGASLLRIMSSSLPIVAAAIAMIVFFHMNPSASGTTVDIQGWKVALHVLPWIALILWTVYTIVRSANAVGRRLIIDRDHR